MSSPTIKRKGKINMNMNTTMTMNMNTIDEEVEYNTFDDDRDDDQQDGGNDNSNNDLSNKEQCVSTSNSLDANTSNTTRPKLVSFSPFLSSSSSSSPIPLSPPSSSTKHMQNQMQSESKVMLRKVRSNRYSRIAYTIHGLNTSTSYNSSANNSMRKNVGRQQ